MLADKFNVLQRGLVRAERIFEIINTDDHLEKGGKVNIDFGQTIKFNDVSFAYKEPNEVVKNINFDIKPGEMVAFVGATGGEKQLL